MKILATFIVLVLLSSCRGIDGPTGPTGPSGQGGQNGIDGRDGQNGKDGTSDKQIRILFPFPGGLGTADTAGFVTGSYAYIVKFNKDYYVGADSIIFAGMIRSSNPNTSCRVTISNITDGVIISASLITSNNTSYELAQSQNLLSYFPSKEITLGVKIQSSSQGTLVEMQQAGIYLYRK